MKRKLALAVALSAMAALVWGCLGSGGSGMSVAKNLMRKDSNLKIFLDGKEAKQNTLKKGLKGYSPFTIKDQVSGSPTFRYEIIDPKKHGFIKSTAMAVHQKFEADFSDLADYVIHTTGDQDFKPGVDYDLGNLPEGFKILDKKDNEVPKVIFEPGKEYLLVFTLVADKSESIQIYFKSN